MKKYYCKTTKCPCCGKFYIVICFHPELYLEKDKVEVINSDKYFEENKIKGNICYYKDLDK